MSEKTEKRPEYAGLEKEKKMFNALKRTAQLLRAPSQAERDMDYLNQATDRYDLEARERYLDRRVFNRTIGL
ncbi:MAG: hypothetical protein H6R00_3448 [Proteobacteria bacterium]|nr:hypothetical protein [Pseudomonadota bacterium]